MKICPQLLQEEGWPWRAWEGLLVIVFKSLSGIFVSASHGSWITWKETLGSYCPKFCITLGSYLIFLCLYCFLYKVEVIICIPLVYAPSNLRAFACAVPSTWLRCAQSLKFSWNGFSSGKYPMNPKTYLCLCPFPHQAVCYGFSL